MNHDRSRRWPIRIRIVFWSTIFQVEALGELEVELDRGTLERTMQRIFDHNVDFWAVESTISRVKFPFSRVSRLECFCKLLKE